MKQIGIITHYYGSKNYGGVLQSYALCQFLKTRDLMLSKSSLIKTKVRASNGDWEKFIVTPCRYQEELSIGDCIKKLEVVKLSLQHFVMERFAIVKKYLHKIH